VVTGSAEISVVTQGLVERGHAPHSGVAGVVSARVVISAHLLTAAHTQAVLADVELSAHIAVVAVRTREFEVDAAVRRNARVVGAVVAVVAARRRTPNALSILAAVLDGTDVAVVAGFLVALVYTARCRVARIIRAVIPIVAVHLVPAEAHPLHTLRVEGTRIGVVAQESSMMSHERTLARSRVAVGLEAEGVLAIRSRAIDYSLRVDGALVGPRFLVAQQGAVAQVVIVKGIDALLVALTLATHRSALAPAFHALVCNRTGVFVVALGLVGRILAPAGLGAEVVGARVVVIAIHRVSNARAVRTMVGYGAGIVVAAVSGVEDLVHAAILACTLVLSAVVAVIAQVEIVAFDQVGFIGLAVAIVIKPVADLFGRDRRVTFAEAFRGALALALAHAPVVLDLARRGKGQFNGLVRAGTHTGIGYALAGQGLASLNLLAGEAPRTVYVLGTGPAAEAAFVPIGDTPILRGPHGLAVTAIRTGLAQVGVVGDADPDHVGSVTPYLLAAPALGAFLLADLGADSVAHMLHAPPGLALAVLVAFVEEAALAGVAPESGDVRRRNIASVTDDLRQGVLAARIGDELDINPIPGPGSIAGRVDRSRRDISKRSRRTSPCRDHRHHHVEPPVHRHTSIVRSALLLQPGLLPRHLQYA